MATAAKGAAVKRRTIRVLVERGVRAKTGLPGHTAPPGPMGDPGAPGASGAPAADVARSLTLNWKGAPGDNGSASATIPAIGRLDLTCRGDTQELRLTPSRSDARTIATVDRFQSASVEHERRASTGDPIVIPLPVNGMLTGVFSIEPIGGDGGSGPAAAMLTLSSEMKLNAVPGDPADVNFSYVAAQVLPAAG